MAIIRQNSVSGIVSVTAQSNALDFYDNTGNKLTIGADVSGNVTGNLTGNVTGDVTGDVTGNLTGNATGITTSQITVGDAFIKANAVGLGGTDTTGRNAGVSTALGTLIYNTTTSSIEAYGPNGWILVKGLNIIDVEMMLIGGGGGGAGDQGGGGGAGALYYTSSIEIGDTLPISITVGTGGGSSPTTGVTKGGINGGDSAFGADVTAVGGGGGMTNPATYDQPGAGGSGGGGSYYVNTGGTASGTPGGTNNSVSPSSGWGNSGGDGVSSDPAIGGAGGGGAGGAGGPATGPRVGGAGGVGLTYGVTGSSVGYAGGGGGYGDFGSSPTAGVPFGGGLGISAPDTSNVPIAAGTDGKGGGGGACRPPIAGSTPTVSDGGDGVCIIAYVGTSSKLTFNPGASVTTSTSSRVGYVVHTISAPTSITAVS